MDNGLVVVDTAGKVDFSCPVHKGRGQDLPMILPALLVKEDSYQVGFCQCALSGTLLGSQSCGSSNHAELANVFLKAAQHSLQLKS